MRTIVNVIITAFVVVSIAAGFSGWDNSKSYAENVEAIFSAKEMNEVMAPYNNSSANWTVGDKPIRAIDGTPMSVKDEQDQINEKTDALLNRKDPYAQEIPGTKPVRKIDGSWNNPTEQEMVDNAVKEFLGR